MISSFLTVVCFSGSVMAETNDNTTSTAPSILEQYYSMIEVADKDFRNGLPNNYSRQASSDVYSGDFEIFNHINENPEDELIVKSVNDESIEGIVYDKNNDLYLYYQTDNPNSYYLIVNGLEFTYSCDGNNITVTSGSGETLNASSFTPDPNQDNFEITTDVPATRAGSWILGVAGLKGTNQMYMTVLHIVVEAGIRIAQVRFSNIPGAVFDYISDSINESFKGVVTVYIVYDRYYMSDCTTYFRDYNRCYQYDYYNGYMGAGNSYFHSVNPSHAGQNCYVYA